MAKAPTSKPRKPRGDIKQKLVESSAIVDTRPRQPVLRKSRPNGAAPLRTKKTPKERKPHPLSYKGLNAEKVAQRLEQDKVSAEIIEAARATGLLPHEWLLAVMRGEQLNHFAYDSESGEIIEVVVLPTFSDRVECAKATAPYYGTKMTPSKQGDAGGPVDPAKQRGVMEVPLADSMEHWTSIAGPSQAKLKREVTK